MSSQDLFEDSPEAVYGTPVEFSGVSGSGGSSDSPLPSQSQPMDSVVPTVYQCDARGCKRVLKTLQGFKRHQAAHKINDANARRPDVDDFAPVIYDFVEKVVQEMEMEPSYGESSDSKKLFLAELKTKTETMNWAYFVAAISDPILSFVCESSKVMPMNQYEEAHIHLNKLLNDREVVNGLQYKLMAICDQEISEALAGRLVFRIALKLLDHLQIYIAKEMRGEEAAGQADPRVEEFLQSEEEERAFLLFISVNLRSFYQNRLKSPLRLNQQQCLNLKEKFICSQGVVTSEQFLSKHSWFSGDENCIVLSENASNFFKILESVCQKTCAVEKLSTKDEVLETILKNSQALNLWFFLTNSYFSEDDSLHFMKQMVSFHVSASLHLEESRKNMEEDKTISGTKAPLRAHLQRNLE